MRFSTLPSGDPVNTGALQLVQIVSDPFPMFCASLFTSTSSYTHIYSVHCFRVKMPFVLITGASRGIGVSNIKAILLILVKGLTCHTSHSTNFFVSTQVMRKILSLHLSATNLPQRKRCLRMQSYKGGRTFTSYKLISPITMR